MTDLETTLLDDLRRIATHRAALGLKDDAAILDWPLGSQLVATHDMLAEGVHFTSDCPPADVGWKLAAVNLSDLAAMGARPVAVLMGAGIGAGRSAEWTADLVRGLAQALTRFGVPLIGGDTIRTADTSILSLTALGQVPAGTALQRWGAQAGDDIWVSGTIGDAGLGLQVALGQRPHDAALLKRYRRPMPRLALGLALRGIATAMIDVSDGLLIDAGRLAEASGLAARVEGTAIPLSDPARASGTAVADLAAMGDDYELLFSAPTSAADAVLAAAATCRTPVTRIGILTAGVGLLLDGSSPDHLGHRHH